MGSIGRPGERRTTSSALNILFRADGVIVGRCWLTEEDVSWRDLRTAIDELGELTKLAPKSLLISHHCFEGLVKIDRR